MLANQDVHFDWRQFFYAFHFMPQEIVWTRFRILLHLRLLANAHKREGIDSGSQLEVSAILLQLEMKIK